MNLRTVLTCLKYVQEHIYETHLPVGKVTLVGGPGRRKPFTTYCIYNSLILLLLCFYLIINYYYYSVMICMHRFCICLAFVWRSENSMVE